MSSPSRASSRSTGSSRSSSVDFQPPDPRSRPANGNHELLPLCAHPYYHPRLSNMDQVMNVMMPYSDREGHYLVRHSFSKPGLMTVSVTHRYGIKHFNITCKDNSYFIHDQHFSSLDKLLLFYGEHDVPNLEHVENVRLLKPIACSDSSYDYLTTSQVVEVMEPLRRPVRQNSLNSMSDFAAGNSAQSHSTQSHSTTSSIRCKSAVDSGAADRQSMVNKLREIFRGSNRSEGRGKKMPSHHDTGAHAGKSTSTDRHLPANLTFSSNANGFGGQGHSSELIRRNSRPPAPPPGNAAEISAVTRNNSNPAETDSPRDNTAAHSFVQQKLYYSSTRDIMTNPLADVLIAKLREEENGDETDGRCQCGLTNDESVLPRGWSLHLSTEPATKGRVFFTSPEGKTTWYLPVEVSVELDPEQQDRIRNLLRTHRSLVSSGDSRSVDGDAQPSSVSLLAGQSAIAIQQRAFGVNSIQNATSNVLAGELPAAVSADGSGSREWAIAATNSSGNIRGSSTQAGVSNRVSVVRSIRSTTQAAFL